MTADGMHALNGALSGDAEAPSASGSPPQDDPGRVAALEAELAEVRDRWMRAEAEVANVRARARRDVEEARQYAVQRFATDVVEAAENLRRGLDSLPLPSAAEPEIVRRLRDGLHGVERNFVAVLARSGVEMEDPTGTPFNPDRHQAMSEQDTHGHLPGTVLQAYTPAWTLNGRLLRPAMVVVARAPAAQVSGPHPSIPPASIQGASP